MLLVPRAALNKRVVAFVPSSTVNAVAQRCRVRNDVLTLNYRRVVPAFSSSFPKVSKRSMLAAQYPSSIANEEGAAFQQQESLIDTTSAVQSKEGSDTQKSGSSSAQPFMLIPAASSDRGGTGVGIALVSASRDESATSSTGNENRNVRESIGVFFEQQRSLFETEYTALIVALEWLQAMDHREPTTLCVRDDIVYNQLRGLYPVQKESIQRLHRKALDLIEASPCEIRLGFQTDGSLYTESKSHASRVLLMEKGDSGTIALDDPLLVVSSLAVVEDSPIVEIVPNAPEEDELELSEYMFDSPFFGNTDEDLLDRVTKTSSDPELFQTLSEQEIDNVDVETVACQTAIDPQQTYVLQFDGGARGNPGPAGCGMIIYDAKGKVVWQGAKYLGNSMTNNQAEYIGVLLGLKHAYLLGIQHLRCEGDSQLIIKQLQGSYKVKNEGLKPLYESSMQTIKKFGHFELVHIYREHNSAADGLANGAMDDRASIGLMVDG